MKNEVQQRKLVGVAGAHRHHVSSVMRVITTEAVISVVLAPQLSLGGKFIGRLMD